MDEGKVPPVSEGPFRRSYEQNRRKRLGRKADLWLENEWVWLGALVSVFQLHKAQAKRVPRHWYRMDTGPLDSTEFIFSFVK